MDSKTSSGDQLAELQASSNNIPTLIDLATILKAAQTISQEIQVERLLNKLMQVVMENSGSQTGSLILKLGREWQISGHCRNTENCSLQSLPLEDSQQVPLSLINYIQQTQATVVIDNVATNNSFASDPYWWQRSPQSVLGLPILNQGNLIGILYLENQVTAGVFTPDRVQILSLLCSTAAISLENARLFQTEQEKSQALQASLEKLKESELRFQRLFEKSTDAILLLGSNGFINCNPAAIDLFGYSDKDQICHVHPSQLSPEFQPDGQSSFEKAKLQTDMAFATGSHRFEWVHQRKNQENFWAEVVLTPIDWEGTHVLHAMVRDVSDRKQIEIILAKSESKFRSLVEDASDVIYALNPDGIFTYVSPQIAEITGGYQPCDFVGQSCANFTHPEDVPLMVASFQKVFQTGCKPNELELRIRRKDDSWCWLVFKNSLIKDTSGQIIGIQGIGRDVTAAKAAFQERQRQADALKMIVEGTAGKTGQAFYQACTQYMAEIFNVQYAFLAKLTDQKFATTQMLSFWDGEGFLPPFVFDLKGTSCLVTYQNSSSIFPKDLQCHFPESGIVSKLSAESYMSVVIRDFQGNIVGNLGILDTKPLPSETADLKFIMQLFANRVAAEMERQADEDALRQTNQQLEITVQELQRATRLKDEFLATMSHELRTPLNAILGMTEILQEGILGAVSERQLKSLGTIERSAQHLLSLINDILDLSKISAGKLELDVKPVSVVELIDSSLISIRQQANVKQIHLEVKLTPGFDLVVVDERRIRQVLINLLSNAVKFTQADGHITVSYSFDQSNGWIEFSVADTGIGIAAEDQDKLFKPFIQLDSSLNRRYQGTGLGLALVRQIVELHGGRVHLESQLGRGSNFIVRLPQRCTSAEESSSNGKTTRPELSLLTRTAQALTGVTSFGAATNDGLGIDSLTAADEKPCSILNLLPDNPNN